MFDFEHNLERANFLAWYPTATPEEIQRARENDEEKLNELIAKYRHDLELLEILNG